VFQNREIDEAWRADAVTIWIWAAVADQIKPELTFWRFNAAVDLPNRWAKSANFDLRIQHRSSLNLRKGLFQDRNALAHLQRAHHQPIVSVAMFTERDSEFKPGIKSVAIDLADVVVHTTRPQHRARDAGIDRQFGGNLANILGAADDDLVA